MVRINYDCEVEHDLMRSLIIFGMHRSVPPKAYMPIYTTLEGAF